MWTEELFAKPYQFLQTVYQVVIIYIRDNHWNKNISNNISSELFYDNLTVTSAEFSLGFRFLKLWIWQFYIYTVLLSHIVLKLYLKN